MQIALNLQPHLEVEFRLLSDVIIKQDAMWPHWRWFATAIPALSVAIVNWALWLVKWILTSVPAFWTWFLPTQSLSKAKDYLCLHHLPISHLCPFCHAATWLEDHMTLELEKPQPPSTDSAAVTLLSYAPPAQLTLAVSSCSCCWQEVPGMGAGLHTTLWLYILHCGSGAAQKSSRATVHQKGLSHHASGQGWGWASSCTMTQSHEETARHNLRGKASYSQFVE